MKITIIGTASCPLCDLLGEDGDFCRANKVEGGHIFHSTCGVIYPAWLVNNHETIMSLRGVMSTIVQAIVEVNGEAWLAIDKAESERDGELTLRLSEKLPSWVKDTQSLAITITLGGHSATTPSNGDDSLRPSSRKHQKVCNRLLDAQFKLETIAPPTFSGKGMTVKVEKKGV